MPAGDRSTKQQSDALQRFFIRPFFLSLTIGIPFCIFKLIFGLSAMRAGTPGFAVFGWIVIGWACADLAMNIGRSVYDLAGRIAPFEYCTIAQIGRKLGRPMVFLAIDTLLSFAIICLMLWSGWIARLSSAEAYLWYGATTLNLISLSAVSLYNEIRKE
ncbi:MAG TPA: hypothetical protein HA263_10300 [Methanoregulaceae archaeon]|nr:hypothetical protein [Methanoregulaceae archaeon]